MTEKEAFKLGFIARCLYDGVPREQIPGRTKLAFDSIINAMKSMALPAIATAGIAPAAFGGTAAYLKNRALDTDNSTDLSVAKSEELAQTLEEMTERLRQRRRELEARKMRSANRQIFL